MGGDDAGKAVEGVVVGGALHAQCLPHLLERHGQAELQFTALLLQLFTCYTTVMLLGLVIGSTLTQPLL